MLLAVGLLNGAPLAEGANVCRQTALRLGTSCQAGARSDFWLADAKCGNLANPSARKSCEAQAGADQKDATKACTDEQDARFAACEQLGPAPYDPVIDPANFVATIDNPYLPLKPGTTFIYESATDVGLERTEFVVTRNTKVILGVTCIEVRDTVTLNGQVTEDTLDWFAQDRAGNVWYFGENSRRLADGLIVSLAGSWTAGVAGAKPGIVMKAHPAVGDFYRQESALGTAEDMAEVVSLNESVTVPFGAFDHCLKTAETTPLAPEDLEHKFYCKGVGLVLTTEVATGTQSRLIRITTE
jgi:hypothetical protein